MKIEIKIDSGLQNPYAVIHTPKLTSEIVGCVEILESMTKENAILTAKIDDKSFFINPEEVELIRTEGGHIKLYNRQAQGLTISKTLQELHNQLGIDFIRISKSAIININRIDHVSPSFNGTMNIVMKNGIDDYISRKFMNDFKKRLGL